MPIGSSCTVMPQLRNVGIPFVCIDDEPDVIPFTHLILGKGFLSGSFTINTGSPIQSRWRIVTLGVSFYNLKNDSGTESLAI